MTVFTVRSAATSRVSCACQCPESGVPRDSPRSWPSCSSWPWPRPDSRCGSGRPPRRRAMTTKPVVAKVRSPRAGSGCRRHDGLAATRVHVEIHPRVNGPGGWRGSGLLAIVPLDRPGDLDPGVDGARAETSSALAMAHLDRGMRSAVVTNCQGPTRQGSTPVTARGSSAVLLRLAYLGVTNTLALLRLLPTSDPPKTPKSSRSGTRSPSRTAPARRKDSLHLGRSGLARRPTTSAPPRRTPGDPAAGPPRDRAALAP